MQDGEPEGYMRAVDRMERAIERRSASDILGSHNWHTRAGTLSGFQQPLLSVQKELKRTELSLLLEKYMAISLF